MPIKSHFGGPSTPNPKHHYPAGLQQKIKSILILYMLFQQNNASGYNSILDDIIIFYIPQSPPPSTPTSSDSTSSPPTKPADPSDDPKEEVNEFPLAEVVGIAIGAGIVVIVLAIILVFFSCL